MNKRLSCKMLASLAVILSVGGALAALSDWDQTIPWRYDTSGRAAYHIDDPTPVSAAQGSSIDLRLRTVNRDCNVVPYGIVIGFR